MPLVQQWLVQATRNNFAPTWFPRRVKPLYLYDSRLWVTPKGLIPVPPVFQGGPLVANLVPLWSFTRVRDKPFIDHAQVGVMQLMLEEELGGPYVGLAIW